MPAGQEVLEFAQKAGAQVPREGTELYRVFRSIFRRLNCFFLNNKVLISKMSRKTKPFRGVGKKYLDLLDGRFEYFLVLLASSNEGWVFSETEVKRNMANDTGRLAKDRNCKIHVPLPDHNSFSSPERFLQMVERHGT